MRSTRSKSLARSQHEQAIRIHKMQRRTIVISSDYQVLPASEIAVGHCVCLNHVEQPCGRLLAVVTGVSGSDVWCKYLNSETYLTSYNKGDGMRPSFPKEITPVGAFGVEVRFTIEGGDVVYWCVPIGESTAKYLDGTTRRWQECGIPGRYVARPDVLRIANRQLEAIT